MNSTRPSTLRFHSAVNANILNADASGQLDVTITIIDDDGAPSVLDAPTFGTPTADSLVVNWTAPARAGGSAITGYEVRYKEVSRSGTGTVNRYGSDVLSATIPRLDPNTAYWVQVRALNDVRFASSAWSAQAYVSTTVAGAIFSGTLTVAENTFEVDTVDGTQEVTTVGYHAPESSGALTSNEFNDIDGGARRFVSLAFLEQAEQLFVQFSDAGPGSTAAPAALPGAYVLYLDDDAAYRLDSDSQDSDNFRTGHPFHLPSHPGYYIAQSSFDPALPSASWVAGDKVAVSLVAVPAPKASIPPATVAVLATYVVDAADFFVGPQEEGYSVYTDDRGTATVELSGTSTVTVTGVRAGHRHNHGDSGKPRPDHQAHTGRPDNRQAAFRRDRGPRRRPAARAGEPLRRLGGQHGVPGMGRGDGGRELHRAMAGVGP